MNIEKGETGRRSSGGLLESYCYGPVDLIKIHKGDSTMWLSLQDAAGRTAKAIYRGCVYWRLDQQHEGIHLSLVQRATAGQLLQRTGSVTLLALQKNADHVAQLLKDWEAGGLSFYLHFGSRPEEEFLVAAQSLEYYETD